MNKYRKLQGINPYFEGEEGYLELLQYLIDHGFDVPDRTGVGCKFIPGLMLKFDISNYVIPLMTTRKIPWKNVVYELLFFLKGQTNSKKYLEPNGVKIWTHNTTSEFLKTRNNNLEEKDHIPEGDIGKMYGYQWINWGGTGLNQIDKIIHQLKTDPFSRRNVISAWNAEDLKKGCLEPCHVLFQFMVHKSMNGEETKEGSKLYLSCCLTMRSTDSILGLPTNIASYSLLTFIISHYVGMQPGFFTVSMNHCHIYNNHIEKAKILLQRPPSTFPGVKLINMPNDYKSLKFENFILWDYNPQKFIKFPFCI